MEVIMGSLSFEPTDENIELVEALLEGLNEISKKLSATQEKDEDEFKCDKIHHCDCDCPECSPESYV